MKDLVCLPPLLPLIHLDAERQVLVIANPGLMSSVSTFDTTECSDIEDMLAGKSNLISFLTSDQAGYCEAAVSVGEGLALIATLPSSLK